ncbi:hypothetical protein PQR72_26440 [Paraburkholderia madseniana]|nr:hypothetical protein [Paraburkholderia madseniana]
MGISKQAAAQQPAANNGTSARRFLRRTSAQMYERLDNPIIDIFHFL